MCGERDPTVAARGRSQPSSTRAILITTTPRAELSAVWGKRPVADLPWFVGLASRALAEEEAAPPPQVGAATRAGHRFARR